MEANRPESARRLWERLSPNDPSVWIRYSAALIEFVSWSVLKEESSNRDTAERLLASAIKTNIYCAFYLAFFDTFDEVMDYTDEIEDATDDSPLEQAIEVDRRLRALWIHHPRFILVRHDASFFKKIALGLAELDNMVNEHSKDRAKSQKSAPRKKR